MATTPTYALRYPVLADAPNVPSDLQKLASDIETLLVAMRPVTTQAVLADYIETTSGSFVGLTGNPGAVFVAPRGGRVLVNIRSAMVATAADASAVMGFEVRTGSTIGGGSVVVVATSDDAIKQKGVADIQAGVTVLVSGLTAGAVYHARCMYRRLGSSGAAGFASRAISVTPAT